VAAAINFDIGIGIGIGTEANTDLGDRRSRRPRSAWMERDWSACAALRIRSITDGSPGGGALGEALRQRLMRQRMTVNGSNGINGQKIDSSDGHMLD